MKKLRQLKNAIRGKSPDTRKNFPLSNNENSGYSIDLKNGFDDNFTKLHYCCWVGDEAKVRKHVKKIDANSQDSQNRTPVHLAAAQGYKDIVMVLLENKADIEIKDSQGRTPLMKVTECGHADLLGILLGYGANVDDSDYNGNTSLHIALENEHCDMSLILLQHNAAVNVKNKDGITPLHIAATKKQLNVAKIILQKGALINAVDKESQTPLILACKVGSLPLTSLLIEYGADPLLKDNMGHSAADYCNMSGDSQIAQLFIKDTTNKEDHPQICDDRESSERAELKQAELDLDIADSWNDSETTESSKKLPIAAKLLLPDDYPEEILNSDKSMNEMHLASVPENDFTTTGAISHSNDALKNENEAVNEVLQATLPEKDFITADAISHSSETLKNENEGNESQNVSVPGSHSKSSGMFSHSTEQIKKRKEDLFADLGFSDSIASDESSSLESSDDQKCENKQELLNNIEDNDKVINCGQIIEETKNYSPSEQLLINKSDDAKNKLIYEPYIPSISKRRFSHVPEGCAIKQHSFLNKRSTSLDFSYPNENPSIPDETLMSKDNFPISPKKSKISEREHSVLMHIDAKVNSEHIPKNTVIETNSESDWDSEDSASINESKYTNIQPVESQNTIPPPLKGVESHNDNMPNEDNTIESHNDNISKDNTTEFSSPQNIRPDGCITSQNNSDLKANASPTAECNSHSEQWSTLGRPGTLQGNDEIWEKNPRIKRSSSEHNSPAKFPKQHLPMVNNKVLLADEDSSTTLTDTEEDKIQRKPDGPNSDLNDALDDTLSISTDEELFHEDACDKNNALLHHTVTPSELAALQANVREQRLAVNKKNDKINSLKCHQKTLLQEKAQAQEKLRKAVSNNGSLKNTILDLKNQLSSLLYSLQEEKQNRENAEALLNAVKEKMSHKHNLYVNENKLRRSLENMLQSEKDEHNSANDIINLLQSEVDKLRLQLEQKKKLVQDYEKKNSSLQLNEKSTNMLQAEMDELKLELKQQKTLVQEYENKTSSLQMAEKATNTNMAEADELKLELEWMKKLVQEYEKKNSSLYMADKSTNTVMQVDLDDKISKLSEEVKSLQSENQRLVAQLQSTNDELQAKQHEFNIMTEKHVLQLKTVETEKEDIEKKARMETDKERSLRKELEDMAEKMKILNTECGKYKQTIDALHKAVLLCQTSEEFQNTFSSYLEKLKSENKDLKFHLDEIRELHSCTKDVVCQGKEEAIDILSSINKQLEMTRIELDEKSKEISNLYSEVKQKEQSCFEKDLKIERLEQENHMMRAKAEMLNERLSECEKKTNALQSKLQENSKSTEVHMQHNTEQTEETFHRDVNVLEMKKSNLEKELMKEQQYSASLGTTLNLYKQNENILHTQIQGLKTENQELQDNLCQEKDHNCALHFKLNAFNEIEEVLSQKVQTMEREKLQLEEEVQKEREHSNILDSKHSIFNQNLKKMEELISGLQTMKEKIEFNRIAKSTHQPSDVKEICSNCPPYDVDSIIQLTEKLKDMEHLKNEKEALLLKEKRKALKALKSKKTTDSLLQKEKQRIHQLMDVIADLKMELETANKKIKDLENLSNTSDKKFEQDDWKSRADELNAQIEQFRQQAEKEYNQRKEMEATCSLMKTELNSLRTVQTTLIEELLNELKSVKSQSQEQTAVACQMESWYKRAENMNNEGIYNTLKDISLQLRQRDSSTDSTMKVNFAETKHKLMEELAQLKTTMKHKEHEYEILEVQRNQLHRNYESQKPREENLPYQAHSEQDMEVPIKLPSERRIRSTFPDSFVTSRRWSNSSHLISSSQQIREMLPQPISPIRDSQQLHRENSSKAESDDSSSRLLPEIQAKLDNAIAKHLNSTPRIDISIPSHHSADDNSASNYMSSLQKRYFV